MTTLFIRHKVADYGAWKRVYDSVGPLRADYGVTAASVHRDADDPNDVIVVHRFADLAAAHAFTGAAELRTAMGQGGVVGAPTFWFGEDVE